jgi:rhodanese-related sulfurtransferase
MNEQSQFPDEITVQMLHQMRSDRTPHVLLDVREPSEHATAHIEGSVLIPMGQIVNRVDELETFRDKRLVVHCHHGGRSARVTQWLRQNGFDRAQNLEGGIDAWSQQIDPNVPRY